MPKTRKRYEADDRQCSRSTEVPVGNFVPQVKQSWGAISLPGISSIPPPTEDQVYTNTVRNAAAQPPVVPNRKILNKKFQTEKSRSQEAVDTDDPETKHREVAGGQTRNGCCRPQEYFPPPPFAPGY